MLSLACAQAGRPSTFFQSAGFDTDSRVNSLTRKIGYLQSKLGVETYEFEFATPKDKKLIATFKAEQNGNPIPELSGIYQIPPTGVNQNSQGWISVTFFHPQYQSQTPQSPSCELSFSSSGVGHSFTTTSPFLPTATQSRGTSTSAAGSGRLDDEQEREVWDYHTSSVGENKSEQYDFKYTLTIKLAPVEKEEDLQKIRKEDFK